MDKSFSQFSKVVNKHVLGNQDEFVRLKDKLEMCEHATSKSGAAALGYLMAMLLKAEENYEDQLPPRKSAASTRLGRGML